MYNDFFARNLEQLNLGVFVEEKINKLNKILYSALSEEILLEDSLHLYQSIVNLSKEIECSLDFYHGKVAFLMQASESMVKK